MGVTDAVWACDLDTDVVWACDLDVTDVTDVTGGVHGVHWVHVFYESGLAANVLYGVEPGSKRAVGFKQFEGVEPPRAQGPPLTNQATPPASSTATSRATACSHGVRASTPTNSRSTALGKK